MGRRGLPDRHPAARAVLRGPRGRGATDRLRRRLERRGVVPAARQGGARPVSAGVSTASSPFAVHLDNFDGPFDLLLQLIAKHQLDSTEVSLSTVTDDFLAHLKVLGADWQLEETTQFLVVAAT